MNYAPRARFTLNVSRYGLVLLLLLNTVQTLNQVVPNWTLWSIGALPIIFILRPVWQGRPMAHAWLCFLLLMYFIVAVQNIFSPSCDIFDVLRLVMVVTVFLSAMMYVRWGSRALRAEQQAQEKNLSEDVLHG
jgi:uncharacterized membrane protein